MTNYKIYQDLDGCLVDFENGYHKFTGKKCRGVLGKDGNWVNDADFWTLIDYDHFWANLDWMHDGKELHAYIADHGFEVLSAPSKSDTSRRGKKQWMENHLPGVKMNLVPRWEKIKFVSPNHILIDDLITTIEEWNNAGGIGILHTSAENTIKELQKLGI